MNSQLPIRGIHWNYFRLKSFSAMLRRYETTVFRSEKRLFDRVAEFYTPLRVVSADPNGQYHPEHGRKSRYVTSVAVTCRDYLSVLYGVRFRIVVDDCGRGTSAF